MRTAILLIIVTAITVAVNAHAQSLSVEACKRAREKIAHYDTLRRHGGSVTQMESWKTSRVAQEKKFREAKCKKYGKRVR